MRITSIIILFLATISVVGQNYLKNGSFEYGLNTGWEYAVTSNSQATFTLDKSTRVMDGSVELKINVSSIWRSEVNSVKATTHMTAGNDSLYLLRFWARGPEESKIYVEVAGSSTPGVLYEMHTGKTLFHLPFKFDPNKPDKEIQINFYFRDDLTKQKINNSTTCVVNTLNGATYFLDGVEVLDTDNKQNIDVINTYNWNHNRASTVSGWVAGDNDVSLLLPDGRTIWFFNDSFYAKNNRIINRLSDIGRFIRNGVVIQELNGNLITRPVTDQGGQWVYFRIPQDQVIMEGSSVKNFFWVGDAIMEDGKVKVHLIEVAELNGTAVDTKRSYVASFSYPALEYLGMEIKPDFCASFETFFVDDADNKIYLYRSEGQSYTHVARADNGNLNGKNGAWEYWNGSDWTTKRAEGDSPAGRTINMMADGVTKLGPGNYAQVSMPPMSHDVQVSFAPAPQGPWTAKQTVYTATRDSASWYYMPNFHGQLPNGNYSISFSANFTYCLFFCRTCDTWAFVDKYWYRPRYIQVDLLALSPFSPKIDCAGVADGNAYIDACEECVGGTTGKEPCISGIAKLYSECNYTGTAIGLNVGDYSAEDLVTHGFFDNDLSSLVLEDGYVAELYDENGFAGDSVTINSSVSCIEAASFNNKTSSLIIRRKGITDLSGVYAIQNKQSELYMSIEDQSLENKALVIQSEYADHESQQFELDYIGNGYYNIVNKASRLPISTVDFSKSARANIEQWNGLNYVNITGSEGRTISAQYEATSTTESIDKLIDNNTATKYRTAHGRAWVQYQSATPQVVTHYSVVAANNAPLSDPKNWSLYGSNDGTNWTKLDTVSGAKFQSRFEEKEFSISNEVAYTYYRMNMECYSGNTLHLSEWKLWVGVSPEQGVDNQQFIIQDAGDGCVKFFNKHSDMALEVLDGFDYAGANVWQVPEIGQSGTLWKLVDPQTLSAVVIAKEHPQIFIYPNPVTQFLNIMLPIEWQGSDLFIYNINGSLVYTGKVSKTSFDVGHLPSGYYVTKIQKEDDVLVSRFIKH